MLECRRCQIVTKIQSIIQNIVDIASPQKRRHLTIILQKNYNLIKKVSYSICNLVHGFSSLAMSSKVAFANYREVVSLFFFSYISSTFTKLLPLVSGIDMNPHIVQIKLRLVK